MKPPSADRVTRKRSVTEADALFLLENGARMDQKTFHALYEKTPEGFKAELVAGVVYLASRVSLWHGAPHARLVSWLCSYAAETPGTEVYNSTTVILGANAEPQPDAVLVATKRHRRQTWTDRKGLLNGPPELVAEIAHSGASIDLGAKKNDYESAGVREYVVVEVNESRVRWFVNRGGTFAELAPGLGGVLRFEVFPGLWLLPASFFHSSRGSYLRAVREGATTPAHAAFVVELSAPKKKPQ